VIPRLVHQTWRDADVPEALRGYTESWRRLHPGWRYRLWTDADLAALVEAGDDGLAAMFHAYDEPVMRADLGRYLILRAFGGVYADLDAEALRPWDAVLDADRPILAEEPASHAAAPFVRVRGFTRLVSNAVMASPAGHPFWDHLLALLRRCRHAANPLDATGPFVLTAAVESAPAGAAPAIVPARTISPVDKLGAAVAGDGDAAALAHHHWHGGWWKAARRWTSGFGRAQAGLPWLLGVARQPRERRARGRLARAVAAAEAEADAPLPGGDDVLIAVPVRDAASTLDSLLASLLALDHPKARLSLAFLEGGSADDSFARLQSFARAQHRHYRRIEIYRQRLAGPRFEPRYLPRFQRARRAHLARVRNRLLRLGLRDESWVLWLDADMLAFPPDLLARLLAARARVVQPNVVTAWGGPTFDRNGWITERTLEDPDGAMHPYILHGLYQPPIGFDRLYLSDLRYRERVALDSVGGSVLLVDAALHRAGVLFPETPYRRLIETEGFGALLRDHGIEIAGLPNVEAIHADA
jgi:hypothetical protein